MPSPPAPQGSDRLNGWKDIANYLGKAVRTAQRWEHHYGLPVKRLGEGKGQIVFAYRHDIDAWMNSSAGARAAAEEEQAKASAGPSGHPPGAGVPAPASGGPADAAATLPGPAVTASPNGSAVAELSQVSGPIRRAFLYAVVLGCLLLVLVTSLAWLVSSGRASAPSSTRGMAIDPARQPARWAVEDDSLHVFNEAGILLWRHAFAGPVEERDYGVPLRAWIPGVAIEDLDGDGPREVLAYALSPERDLAQTLLCLNADGSLRWARRLDDRVQFGPRVYGPPWLVYRARVMRNADGTQSVWAVFIHGMLFPTVLEQIDAQGTVRSRYWSNGYIDSIHGARWNGREVLLVGAANNEHQGASLAILDLADPSGRAPAADPRYFCSSCPGGDPLEFIVFPPTPVGRIRQGTSTIGQAWVDGHAGLVVMVPEATHGTDLDAPGDIYFTLDERLQSRHIEVSLAYQRLHDWWFRAGRLDRPYSDQEIRRMVPLLRWNGSRYVELPSSGPLP